MIIRQGEVKFYDGKRTQLLIALFDLLNGVPTKAAPHCR